MGGAFAYWVIRGPAYVPPPAAESRPASIEAQLAYLEEYWQVPNDGGFGVLRGTDCVNFTSQTLLARGWAMDDEWGHSTTMGLHGYARAWVSSTAFLHYLDDHPEKGEELIDSDREQVAVGDIAQFDWDSSGDRDHTAVVTAVVKRADGGIDIRLGGHSPSYRQMPVDQLLDEHPGADVYYWHLT